MEVIAIYTGDSANFHVFEVVQDGGEVVGSLYYSKKIDIPEGTEVNLITPSRDKDLWKSKISLLLSSSRDGSKKKQRLEKILKEYT